MNVSEILELARWRLDDTVAPYLWSDRELLLYLSEAQREFARETHVLRDDSTSEICDISVITEQQSYSISPLILDIYEVTLDNRSLAVGTMAELMTAFPNWRSQASSAPFVCIKDVELHKILLFPTPNSDGSLHLSVARLPQYTLVIDTPSTGETQVPEIPEQYHESLVYGMLARAYLKRDTETYNLLESERYNRKFAIEISNAKYHNSLLVGYSDRFVPHRGFL